MLALDRNRVQSDKFTLGILSKDEFECTSTFDCDNQDLNDFFQNDALAHKEELLAETYYLEPKAATDQGTFLPVAFVSYLNDSIGITEEERKGDKKEFWKHLKKSMPYPKRTYSTFPAVKIGRLGVMRKYQRSHIGSSLLNMTKELFTNQNRTGCRFLTVDAYNNDETVSFYQKNGFQFLWDKDKDDPTRIMYFDLGRVGS